MWAHLQGVEFLAMRASLPLVVCLAACLLSLLFLKADLSSLVGQFYAQRSERLILKAWMRQAVRVTPEDCQEKPGICVGKVVVWPFSRGSGGARYQGNQAAPIYWLNPEQLPRTVGRSEQFKAVAIVKRVLPDRIELVFLGSPQAAYGGTTSKSNFGLSQRVDETSKSAAVPAEIR